MLTNPFSALIFTFLFQCISIASCHDYEQSVSYNYGSDNDQAVLYFNKGWEYILDYGQWTHSEEAFRKAVEIDPDFTIAKSLVGKISTDLDERIAILAELEKDKYKLNEVNQLLLEISMTTIELFNARDQKETLEPGFYRYFTTLGESNYKKFVHKFPRESYMKAEYIEFIHANQGPKNALDSLNILASPQQKQLPFFIAYAATLESELGNYHQALSTAKQLEETISNPDIPAPYVLYAQIYSDMGNQALALRHIEKAIKLDDRHIIAHRLKKSIEKNINEKR